MLLNASLPEAPRHTICPPRPLFRPAGPRCGKCCLLPRSLSRSWKCGHCKVRMFSAFRELWLLVGGALLGVLRLLYKLIEPGKYVPA